MTITKRVQKELVQAAWTREEHERFLVALDVFPSGPWKAIADYVGTKDSRQTMTHAQKYRQKHERQQRGLRNKNKAKKTKKQAAATSVVAESQPAAAREQDVPELDVVMAEVTDFPCSLCPARPVLVKQQSDSPRSADEGANTINSDPFAPVVADDSLFSLALDAGAAWLGAKTEGDIMEIFADYDEPVSDSAWPQMWSTNSLEEIVASCSQFDFLGD
ncbi:Myb-like DNA-binding protein [Phytophthora cinnamomi]|uniref:Myb-like DNA-binding protein n=1 Tax=Phytophthora cinnamomi TaxID=4785 RepID=UPI0035595C1D|nr:Myb-like DNA-binding protein [Phytophthora cinnamomi]